MEWKKVMFEEIQNIEWTIDEDINPQYHQGSRKSSRRINTKKNHTSMQIN